VTRSDSQTFARGHEASVFGGALEARRWFSTRSIDTFNVERPTFAPQAVLKPERVMYVKTAPNFVTAQMRLTKRGFMNGSRNEFAAQPGQRLPTGSARRKGDRAQKNRGRPSVKLSHGEVVTR
jgi:hypothetical protein